MDIGQMESALRELETIDQRCGYVEKAVMREDPGRIEAEVREVARLLTGLTKLMRKLYEHAHGQEEEKQEEVRVLAEGAPDAG